LRYLPLFFALWAIALTAQSPWPRSLAGAYAEASWQRIPRYGSVYDADGKAADLPFLQREDALLLHGEYGLTRSATLVGSVPIRRMEVGTLNTDARPLQSPGASTRLGNVSLGLRKGLHDGKLRFSNTFRVDLPAEGFSERSGIRQGYAAFTFVEMLSLGRKYLDGYWFVHAGYGVRTGGYSHFTDVGGEAGWQRGAWGVAATSQWLHALGNGTVDLPATNQISRFYVDNQGWFTLGLRLTRKVHRFWSLHAAVTGIAAGRNVPRSPILSLGGAFTWE
jgi:hypothetical protein